jgi:hypothetical protein
MKTTDSTAGADRPQPTVAPSVVGREAFFAANAKARRFDTVDTLIGRVRLRSLNEGERSQFENDVLDDDLNADRERYKSAKRRLCVLCVVDADGNPVLSEDDVEALAAVDGAVVGQIFAKAKELCGLTDEDIESLVKNSAAARAAASS